MKIYITGLPSGYEVEHLARLFYPMAPLTLTPPEPAEDCLWAEKTDTGLRVLVRQGEKSKTLEAPLPLPVEQGGETPEFALASLTYDLLRSWTGIRPPWGKMTGVRPVRLIHDKRAAGWSAEQIDRFFLQRFDCSEQKYEMAKEIADLQEPILRLGSAPKTYSLYIGIPFCPSRCSYCSFVSCNLDRDRKLVQPYVDCLCKEVAEIRVQAERAGLTLCSIYIGGGTPTSLSAAQLRQLMGTVRENFDLTKVVEYTVEAGRPDCTDAEKLAVIKEYGATRISINPQTFSDEVLANIGRKHSAQDILDCYADARRAGHEDINMDLIAGLPGDTVEGFEHSLRQAIALQPENITVHTLTLKRASRIVIEDQKENDYADVAAMLEKCHLLAEAGYRPYYLYRQKNTLQNLENVGWCKPGHEGYYNIYIMEEVQTILSAGAGGSTKLVADGGKRMQRIFNFKYPNEYIQRFAEVLERKKEWLSFMITIWVPKRLVEVDLYNVAARSPQALAQLSENSYARRVQYAAQKVRGSGAKIVMLTGPSASGKTTSAHCLAKALVQQGTPAQVVSLDNFFKGAAYYPKMPDGTLDYENLETLDLPLIKQCLHQLSETGKTELPIYDFATEQRAAAVEPIDLQGGVCIVEGIHALNPELTGLVPDDQIYRIYAGLREEYCIDGRRVINTQDIRLCRRTLRDAATRGRSPAKTLAMWDRVMDGETRYIKGFKTTADFLLDTSFTYELGLISRLLGEVRRQFTLEGHNAELWDETARRFEQVNPLPLELLPADSMLCEFYGNRT